MSFLVERASLILWPGQAIYLGMGLPSTLHRHHAVQVGISLDAPLQVRTQAHEPYIAQRSFIVGPDVLHQVDAADIPSLFLWSESLALAALARRLRATATGALPELPSEQLSVLLPGILTCWAEMPDAHAACTLLSELLQALLGAKGIEGSNDPRIAAALSRVTPQFLVDYPQPIAHLAAHVHLSPSWFRHLFRREVGLSVQRYLLWQRLQLAMNVSARGASLTEAAHAAGFADSAHLSRVFRATFGLPPSLIFKNSHAVQVIAASGC
ncbi:MAG: AraC family transcriptional regulator [Chloroflexi bacterium OHK40]